MTDRRSYWRRWKAAKRMVDRLEQVDEDVPKYYGEKAKIHKGIQLCEAKNPYCGLPGDSEVQASQYDFNTDLYKTGVAPS